MTTNRGLHLIMQSFFTVREGRWMHNPILARLQHENLST